MNILNFCGENESRPHLMNPFNYKERTVSSNGHILLFSALDKRFDELCKDSYKKALDSIIDTLETQTFRRLPTLQYPIKANCPICDGSKKAAKINCPECIGDGTVDLENDYHLYEGITCMGCKGTGYTVFKHNDVGDCKNCDGNGTSYQNDSKIIIDSAWFDCNYLSKIDKWNTTFFIKPDSLELFFKFDEFCGLLMGIKE